MRNETTTRWREKRMDMHDSVDLVDVMEELSKQSVWIKETLKIIMLLRVQLAELKTQYEELKTGMSQISSGFDYVQAHAIACTCACATEDEAHPKTDETLPDVHKHVHPAVSPEEPVLSGDDDRDAVVWEGSL
jgi:hypothetical protein